jgi:hypothetical protein
MSFAGQRDKDHTNSLARELTRRRIYELTTLVFAMSIASTTWADSAEAPSDVSPFTRSAAPKEQESDQEQVNEANDALGTGKHQVGAAALTVWTKGILLLGALVNYQIGVGGDSGKPRTQFIGAQPFVFLQLGKGYCLRSAPIWYFNMEEPGYNVPFGLGAGKAIITDKVIYNLFIEPQFAMALRGVGQPAVQIFAGITLQFKTQRKEKAAEAARIMRQLRAEQA